MRVVGADPDSAGGAIAVENAAYPGTVGWREITAVGDRMTLRSTSVPRALGQQPADRLPE
jgi:hypothetical protein